MKKTALLAVALAACLGYAPARAADVVSSNIVGYEKLNLAAETFVMGGIQFVNVGGTSATLNELFSQTDIPEDTEIRFFDATQGKYTYFNYIEDAWDDDAKEEVPGWANRAGDLATDPVEIGTGFWISSPEAFQISQAGQVSQSDTVTISLTSDTFYMVANPFPVPFDPNKATWSDNLPYDTEIRVLGSDGRYAYYTYIEDAWDDDANKEVPGWANRAGDLVTSAIAGVGQGFWMKAPDESITLTVSNPVE